MIIFIRTIIARKKRPAGRFFNRKHFYIFIVTLYHLLRVAETTLSPPMAMVPAARAPASAITIEVLTESAEVIM